MRSVQMSEKVRSMKGTYSLHSQAVIPLHANPNDALSTLKACASPYKKPLHI